MTERTLFLAWQDPDSRRWFPVGRLQQRPQGGFMFAYTKGAQAAQDAGFDCINGFDSFDKVYESNELFPLFANRVMRASRPDYPEYIRRLNVADEDADEMAVLAKSGGRRMTDAFEVFPLPEPDEKGRYHVHFFAHGLRHLTDEAQTTADRLQVNDALFLMRDFQNPKDSDALLMRTERSVPVGFCPRYLLKDVNTLLQRGPKEVRVLVEQVNQPPAPIQQRILCSLTAPWPPDFRPCSDDRFQPILSTEGAAR